MKITSGQYKYRNIIVPKDIRPTTEKVREAIFSMIMEWIPGATVLDLFAGSGAMGLEALSRGSEVCYFNEKNRTNFRVLLDNINHCNANEKSIVTNLDYQTCLSNSSSIFDIVILDPPYSNVDYYSNAFNLLQDNCLIEAGSVVVAEHLFENKLDDNYGKLKKIKEKKYGTIGVDIFLMSEY